ncbi:hypothetical protein AB0L06_23960 [Spirillospora sp. NPDC052269]
MYCSTCGDERRFERTPCLDGHGADCPERACVECGAAVLVGPDATAGDHPAVTPGDQVDVTFGDRTDRTPGDGGTSRPAPSRATARPEIPGPLPSASSSSVSTPTSAPASTPAPASSTPSDPTSGEPGRAERALARAVA